MTLSITEQARLEDEYSYWMNRVGNHTLPKSVKEEALREARKLEGQLGLDGENYNSEKFKSIR